MKNIIILKIIVLLLSAYNITAQEYAKIKETRSLPSNISLIDMCESNGDISILASDNQKILLYSYKQNKTKNITKYFKSDRVRLVGSVLSEIIDNNKYAIYTFDGRLVSKNEFPVKDKHVLGELNVSTNNELYFNYIYQTINKNKKNGIIRIKDNKVIYQYDDWGIGYGGLRVVFMKDRYVINEQKEYKLNIFNYNGELVGTIKHPYYKPMAYNAEERKTLSPMVLERYQNEPFYPQVVAGIYYDNNKLIILRQRRPGQLDFIVDVFDYSEGRYIKTIKFKGPMKGTQYRILLKDSKVIMCQVGGPKNYLYLYTY